MSTQSQVPAPLTRRLRPGHWAALDVGVAALFSLALSALINGGLDQNGAVWTGPGHPLLAVIPSAAMSLPVALRRRRPLAAFVLAIATASLMTILLPVTTSPFFFLPAAYVLYLVAAVSRRKVAIIALAVPLVLLMILGIGQGIMDVVSGNAIPVALILIITWTFGYAMGQRRAYAEQLREQAANSAVTEERLRIARELHDVVAHSMTVIAVQAGFGRHVIDTQPGQASEALGAIQTTSREALTEMRRMLGVLRQPERGVVSLAPAPGLADLDRVVARISDTGVRVDLRVLGHRRELPPGIDLSAFRIVQEALTNVVKHAAASSCRVMISYRDDELGVEITDDGQGCPQPVLAGAVADAAGVPDTPGGHGLIGMRERVSLYGGSLTAAPLPQKGFRVAAQLPLGEGTL